jgi:hypothetical protein
MSKRNDHRHDPSTTQPPAQDRTSARAQLRELLGQIYNFSGDHERLYVWALLFARLGPLIDGAGLAHRLDTL